jgi:hypothetical protein
MSHDRIFKEFLRRFLPEFLTLFFPKEAARLEFSTLIFLDKELVINLPELPVRITDVIAEVHRKDGESEVIIVHVEVEARNKRRLPRRMFEYYSLLRLSRQKPVLPLALVLIPNAGGLKWQAYSETLFEHELLRFIYGQVGLRDLPGEIYVSQGNPVAAALAVLMEPIDDLRGEALAQFKLQALRTVVDSDLTEGDRSFLMSVVETYLPQSRIPADLRGEVMEALPEIELMWHERIELEGELKGKREMLLSLLEEKFGSLPQDVIDNIEAVNDLDILDFIGRQLLTANSLNEIMIPGALPPNAN